MLDGVVFITYIDENARSLVPGSKKYQPLDTSAVFEHCQATGHNINPHKLVMLDCHCYILGSGCVVESCFLFQKANLPTFIHNGRS